MNYVYLLKSKKFDETYVGSTNDLKRRVEEHNCGKSISTKRYMPWSLVYYEAFPTESLARAREHNLKHNGNAMRELKKRLNLDSSFRYKKSGAGFIALISAIIISAILILVATVSSFRGFYGRSNVLDAELKERSVAIAEACADQALLELANNSAYLGNATTTITGTRQCYIGSVSGGSFMVRSYYENFYTNLEIVVNTGTMSVVSWGECPNFSPC